MNEVLAVAVLIGILVNNSRLTDLGNHVDTRFDDLKALMDAKFETVNARFDAAHSDLIRVEQVVDARVKHLEDERR